MRHNAVNDALNKRNMTGETGELCEIPKSVDNSLDKKLGTVIHGFRVVLPVRNDQNHVANHLKGTGLFDIGLFRLCVAYRANLYQI